MTTPPLPDRGEGGAVTRHPNLDRLAPLRDRLEHHPVYSSIETVPDLRVFMEHHVFSVWDFMSLIKSLQAAVAPTRVPWVPAGDTSLRYLINTLVAEEESDEVCGPDGHRR